MAIERKQHAESTVTSEGQVIKFGKTTFPVYQEAPTLWFPKLVPIENALPGFSDLVFSDSRGRIWQPEAEHEVLVSDNPENPQTQKAIAKYQARAKEHFESLKRKIPHIDERWRITDFHMEKLEEIAEALNLQAANHSGVLILQGEAGTGKNVMIDMLANMSNREVISVLCNENSVKEDLTFEFYYDPAKGTYKLPSKMIEGLQTPGAIILFDEINALKPGIAKLLNSLFDYRRRIYLPEGGSEKEIAADPSVLFIGTMNPQNYAGVNRLSPEVLSRSRVIRVDYPPYEGKNVASPYKRCDEAEILAAYMNGLSGLTHTEFRKVWDFVVNEDKSNGADRILKGNPQMREDIVRIQSVVLVANGLRKMYEEYQIGDSNEPMDFPTSLREVTDIVMEMNHKQDVKGIVKRVILPKIDDRRQKRLVDATIDSLLPDMPSIPTPRRRPAIWPSK